MSKYQVVGIGNAVVDVISTCDEAFLTRMRIDKGVMQLIERERGEFLYDNMENRTQAPGGVGGEFDCWCWLAGAVHSLYRAGAG